MCIRDREQGAHAHRVDEHILSALNIKEANIDAKADETIRAFNLVRTHSPVSYTHLQGRQQTRRKPLIYQGFRLFLFPVSYTHLDVYKRQQ